MPLPFGYCLQSQLAAACLALWCCWDCQPSVIYSLLREEMNRRALEKENSSVELPVSEDLPEQSEDMIQSGAVKLDSNTD